MVRNSTCIARGYFNPRPPCGGRRFSGQDVTVITYISIHAPRVGGDDTGFTQREITRISIHAPRVGGDLCLILRLIGILNFNPRPPCGGRRIPSSLVISLCVFQSTPPVWGATRKASRAIMGAFKFQSTPPVWGATLSLFPSYGPQVVFQSTPPVWGATPHEIPTYNEHCDFNPRPPCGGRRTKSSIGLRRNNISIHAPRVGGD